MRDGQEKFYKGILEFGQPVYCSLYGGTYGFIYEIIGEQHPETCENLGGGAVVMGGACNVNIVWEKGTLSKMIPEALVRSSIQWAVFTREQCENRDDATGYVPEGFATQSYIDELLQKVKDNSKTKEQQAKEKAEARDKQRKELPGKYPYLITVIDNDNKLSGYALAAKNIRTELKREFPGVKFSVKSSSFAGGCSVDVGWTDGPTTEEVTVISGKYQYGSFNGMEDIYEYNDDRTFPDVFGSAMYVMEQRNISKERYEEAVKDYPTLKVDEHGSILLVDGYTEDGMRDQEQARREARRKSYYIKPDSNPLGTALANLTNGIAALPELPKAPSGPDPFDPSLAAGIYLDNFASLAGVVRLEAEGDESLRKRVIAKIEEPQAVLACRKDSPQAIRTDTADTKALPTEKTPQIEPQEPNREPVEIGEYKGSATILLPMGSRGFCFGIKKAEKILEYVEEIRAFVEGNK